MGVSSQTIGALIEQIDSGELILPEIQRDFVWKRNHILLLFDSLYRGLPIGYLLVWKAKHVVQAKSFKGNRRKIGSALNNFYGYLLDGQQRLSAIRFIKDGDENYPLMFSLWPDDEDSPDEDRFSYETKSKKNNPWYVSVTDIINDLITGNQIIERLKTEAEDFEPDSDSDAIYACLHKLKEIMKYSVGVIEYEDDHYRKATELFIRFNSTGKKLNRTDLVSAELAINAPELVSLSINKACTQYSPQFSFTNTFLIQSMVAVHNSNMNLKKPKDVWASSSEKAVRSTWKKTERGLGRTVEFITGTVKWDYINWLPSINSIIPLIYLLSNKKFTTEERKLAHRWLLKANVYAIFSGSVHTELDRILRGLKKDPTIKKLIKLTGRKIGAIKPYHFDTRRKSGAIMSLYISMLRNNHAKNWGSSRTSLDGNVIGHNAELQVHHFFPKSLLYSKGYNSSDINTFANYTIINKDTNISISDEEPANYINNYKIRKKDLMDQYIPYDKKLWKVDKYKDFISARRKLLARNSNSFLKLS